MSYGMDGWCKEIPTEKRTDKRTETHACDCISRQAAIDELDKGAWGVEWDKTLAKTMIESLPSAQFTQNTRVNSNNALDTISRQAAIDAIGSIVAIARTIDDGLILIDKADAQEALTKLPSAQPEIIRCKDCKHNQLPSTSGNANCEIYYGMTDQNGFCHKAERREVSE